MTRRMHYLLAFLIILTNLFSNTNKARADNSIVYAILFYSPTCSHCQKVITQSIPPIIDKYGDQLVIIGINTAVPEGQTLFQAAIERFQIPPQRRGVPALIVGETVLVGELEIPEKLPDIVEQGLKSGGIDWPDIPGLREILNQDPSLSSSNSGNGETSESSGISGNGDAYGISEDNVIKETIVDKYLRDPLGNTLSIIVLVGMLTSLLLTGYIFLKSNHRLTPAWPEWLLPTLALLGLFIAIYLSYVEISQSEAFCGPIGDCNSVQQSPYALLFGVIPIGIIGIVGYLLILMTWLIKRYGPKEWRKITSQLIWYMALIGLIFSIYLTTLEPFIIGATCAWCLSSAVVITLILWISTRAVIPIKQKTRIRSRV